ncbi:MAG: phospholipase D-like domain-containing protein [Fusobacteriaceae bacterium]
MVKSIKNAELKGTKIKILTSDYMGVTEPVALYRLKELKGTKIFNNEKNISFHPKTYIFKYDNEITEVFIGSSNISHSALMTGVEWNYNFKGNAKDEKIKIILKEFDELYEKNSYGFF